MDKHKHKAIFKGVVMEEYWSIKTTQTFMTTESGHSRSVITGAEIIQNTKEKEEYFLWVGDIQTPLLKDGEKIFIADINKEVVIQERIRSTEDNTFIYKTDVVHTIESQTQGETRECVEKEAEEIISQSKEELDEMSEKTLEELKQNESWYSKIASILKRR